LVEGQSRTDGREVPRKQRQSVKPLQDWLTLSASREEGLYRAHTEGGISMMPQAFGLSGQPIDRQV
jgi:hypothetical protein